VAGTGCHDIPSLVPKEVAVLQTISETPTARRASRLTLRDQARHSKVQPVARVHKCGHAIAGGVNLMRAADGGHLTGVGYCGSVHSCPRCAAIIRQARAVELAAAIERWITEQGRVYFVTLTAPHTAGDSLESSLDALGLAWRSLMSGSSRRNLDGALGVCLPGDEQPWVGMVRAVDLTHGVNGWHPHYHCVLFAGAWVTPSMVQRFVVDPWLHGTGLAGRQAINAGCHVVELRPGDGEAFGLAAYALNADRASMEVMRLDTKKAGAGASPWELLAAAVDGDTRARHLWAEYASTMHGRRSAVWSRRLRAWVGVVEASDEELAAGELESAVLLATITNADHARLRRVIGGEAALLCSIEQGTWRSLLADLRFEWTEPPD
jgi:hypothetical protein